MLFNVAIHYDTPYAILAFSHFTAQMCNSIKF
jgi:hypothetical protein